MVFDFAVVVERFVVQKNFVCENLNSVAAAIAEVVYY